MNPTAAFACSCAPASTFEEKVDGAQVIIFGTVRESKDFRRPSPGGVRITVEVEEVFKGTAYREQIVVTPADDGACGMSPEAGSTWVFFARSGTDPDLGPVLTTDLCAENEMVAAPPSALGTGTPPEEGASMDVERAERTDRALTRGLIIGGVTLASLAALIAAGLAFLWRRQP